MKIRSQLAPPSPELFDSLEESYRIILPPEFRDFFVSNNGGVPDAATIPSEPERKIERFLTIVPNPAEDPGGAYDINVVITQLDERLIDNEELVGMNLIPFALLFAGDFLCLDYRRGGNPKVVIWLHEDSEELAPVTRTVAGDFQEFLNLLD